MPLIDLPDNPGTGAIRALNPKTGERMWDYPLLTKPWAGVLTAVGNLVFGGSDEPKSGNSATDDSVFAFAVNNFQLLRSSPSK